MDFSAVWRAVDALAIKHSLSVSALAKRAGLDPTTFNKSKRESDGRRRWPSMESIHKILASTNTSMAEFVALGDNNLGDSGGKTIPLLGFAQAGRDGYFDENGYPYGAEDWDGIAFPEIFDTSAYALEVSGDSMEPAYREGDYLIVSPNAPLRRGDRVVVKKTDGEVMVKELKRQTALKIELQSLNPEHDDLSIPMSEIAWLARVLWVSQ